MPFEDNNIEPTDKNVLAETQAGYDKAEMNLLKDALKRTHMERLLFATRLYKIQQTLNKATITHQPSSPDK